MFLNYYIYEYQMRHNGRYNNECVMSHDTWIKWFLGHSFDMSHESQVTPYEFLSFAALLMLCIYL